MVVVWLFLQNYRFFPNEKNGYFWQITFYGTCFLMKGFILLLTVCTITCIGRATVPLSKNRQEKQSASVISGKWEGFSPEWESYLVISKQESLDDFYTANPEFRFAVIPFDSSGNFSFPAGILGSELKFYRLSVLPKSKGMDDLIRLAPPNFVFLLLNNRSNARLKIHRTNKSMYYSVESSHPANAAVARFFNRFFGDPVKYNGEIFDNAVRNYLPHADPIVTVVAYRQLFLHDKKLTLADQEFFAGLLDRLEEQYPDLRYTTELKEKLTIPEPEISIYTLVWIGIFVLVGLLPVYFFFTRKKKRSLIREQNDQRKWLSLTIREREILSLLQKGYSNKQIAEQLHIEVTTVKTHVSSTFQKLEIKSRKEVARFFGMSGNQLPAD